MISLSGKLTKMFSLFYINLVRLFKWTELYQPTYNPKNYFLYKKKGNKRNSQDRIDFIKQNIDFSKINTYLDIGSQLGFFVFNIAKGKKIIAQGVEMDYISWVYSNVAAILNEKDNVSFTKAKLTSKLALKLPHYDVISFLNVFHHVVHFEGFEEADKIMKILVKKCNYFIFETGQFGEDGLYWSENLSFMGDNPEEWISSYLVGLGCEIVAIKHFSNHLNSFERSFFICKTNRE